MNYRNIVDSILIIIIIVLSILYYFKENFTVNGKLMSETDKILLENIKNFINQQERVNSDTYRNYLEFLRQNNNQYKNLILYVSFKLLVVKKLKGTLEDSDITNLFR